MKDKTPSKVDRVFGAGSPVEEKPSDLVKHPDGTVGKIRAKKKKKDSAAVRKMIEKMGSTAKPSKIPLCPKITSVTEDRLDAEADEVGPAACDLEKSSLVGRPKGLAACISKTPKDTPRKPVSACDSKEPSPLGDFMSAVSGSGSGGIEVFTLDEETIDRIADRVVAKLAGLPFSPGRLSVDKKDEV